MLPQNLRLLIGLLEDVRRLDMVRPPLPHDVADVLLKVADARAVALTSGNSDMASELAAVSRCLQVSAGNPREAPELLAEARSHMEELCSRIARAE